jgi:hypothetical protein
VAGGGGGGSAWKWILGLGAVLCGVAMGLHAAHAGPGWLVAGLEAVGGLAVIFGSCEAMILSVDGLGRRLKWNGFVAGTMAGLASNIPEIVMLAFVVAKDPRMGFVVVALTLHVGALTFGGYCGLLPRDERGSASLPEPLVRLSTDLFACAGGVLLAMGSLMVLLREFKHEDFEAGGPGAFFTPWDLYVIAGVLLLVEVVAVARLVKLFAAGGEAEGEEVAPDDEPPPSLGTIVGYGVLGIGASVFGGHAVGEFAGTLSRAFEGSEMVGAIVLSVFACSGVLLMILMAHAKGKVNLALSNAAGAINQVPFVVLPVVLILIAAFHQLDIGAATLLPIDLETTSVVFLGFPIMLMLWKSIQDDGKVNWLETTSMVSVFGLIVWFLAAHG